MIFGVSHEERVSELQEPAAVAQMPAACGDEAVRERTIEQAGRCYTTGDWNQAEQLCRTMLGRWPPDIRALGLLGAITAQTHRTVEAAKLLEQVVIARPDDAGAHNNYGNVLHQLGRIEEALTSYERASLLAPSSAEVCNNRGVALQALQRPHEARESFERALRLKPDFVAAHTNLGIALLALKQLEGALASFDAALRLDPDHAEGHNNRGTALQALGRFESALASFERALEIRPDYVKALHGRSAALRALGRPAQALEGLAHALRIQPDLADAWNDRGNALRDLGRIEEALASYERALQIKPDLPAPHNNRGNCLRDLGRMDAALASYARALRLKPDSAEAHNNLGNVLYDLDRHAEALASYERALALQPQDAEIYSNRGNVLRDLYRLEEALASYERALELRPDLAWLYGAWLNARMQVCDWRDLPRSEDLLRRIEQAEHTIPPFFFLALADSPAEQRRVARAWMQIKCPPSGALPPLGTRERGGKICLAYYSADFHQHATAHLAAELFERHDRQQFRLLAFSYGPDVRDGMRARLSAAFDEFLDVRTATDERIARLSREMQVDIAVDLKGFTHRGRPGIFACRAAPIQVSYLGYPGTSAAPYMDYLIADPVLVTARSRPHFSEKIVYLPDSYQVNDRKRPIAAIEPTRSDLGLPATGFVFCCFNNAFKIAPPTFAAWMRILRQVDGSVLWLLQDSEAAAGNLRREAERHGVSAERLAFARRVPLPEHLARHRAADLFLDSLPYNAHTTASDALWAGLPVLTLAGESFAARVGASLLGAIGLPELITTSPEQFETLAVELAASPGRLAQIRSKLWRNRLTTPLFDSAGFTRRLEEAYAQMYRRHQAGAAPEDIHVVG